MGSADTRLAERLALLDLANCDVLARALHAAAGLAVDRVLDTPAGLSIVQSRRDGGARQG
jgi:hypothetical protein